MVFMMMVITCSETKSSRVSFGVGYKAPPPPATKFTWPHTGFTECEKTSSDFYFSFPLHSPGLMEGNPQMGGKMEWQLKKENFKFTHFLVKFTPFLCASNYMQIKFECVLPHPPDVHLT
jgi:hypothetical protein